MRVVVVGSTGMIGGRVVEALRARGDEVVEVSRSEGVVWSGPPEPLPEGTLDGADAVINLSGAPLAGKRWTDAYKEEIRRSRVDLTRELVEAMARDTSFDGAFLAASAVGIYGPSEEQLDESSPPGDDYLARLCRDWEAAAAEAARGGVRVVNLRTGLVLANEGELLPKLASLAKSGLGGPLGGGDQWFPWIHIADEVGIILWALDGAVSGPVNLTAPGVVRQEEFADELREVVGRSFGLPTPAFALKLTMGEAAEMVLSGQRPAPQVALDGGYDFRFPDLGPALRDLLG